MRILHVITGLNMGGAEMVLYRLLSAWDRTAHDHRVISLTDVGVVGLRMRESGVLVEALGMPRGRARASGVLRLARRLRRLHPDLVQSWMYHADLVTGLAAWLARRGPVVWGIHNTILDPHSCKRSTLWTARACARLSRRLPRRIICCAQAAKDIHRTLGYDASKMVVIPNGFDLALFKPDPGARTAVRQELGLPADTLLIGLVARYAPEKDHSNFLAAALRLLQREPEVHFVLCGDGIEWANSELAHPISNHQHRDRFHLLGRREDIPRLMAAFDVSTSASRSEAFPNVLGEAMACEVPCVTTDVGDCARIVGDTGIIVPRENSAALAEGWDRLASLGHTGRQTLGARARQRVAEHFEMHSVARRYTALYDELLGKSARVQPQRPQTCFTRQNDKARFDEKKCVVPFDC